MNNFLKITTAFLLGATMQSCMLTSPNYASTYGEPYYNNGVYYAPQNYYGNGGYYGDDGYYYRDNMRYYYDNGIPYYMGDNRQRVYLQRQNASVPGPDRSNTGFRNDSGNTVNTSQSTRNRSNSGFRNGATTRNNSNQSGTINRSSNSGGFRNNSQNRNTTSESSQRTQDNTRDRSQGGYR